MEHVFHVVKNLIGYRKVRYRWLAKHTAQLYTQFGPANLVRTNGPLLAPSRPRYVMKDEKRPS